MTTPGTADLLRSVVVISVSDRRAGGVIVSPALILTAFHVVSDYVMDPIYVTFKGGETIVGSVVVTDSNKDVALVKLDIPPGYVQLQIKNALPDLDEQLTIIGHPHGIEWTVTRGYLAHPKLEVIELDSACKKNCREMIVDGRSWFGNSGGPIVNKYGQIVGMMNAFSNAPPFTYAVSSTDICKIPVLHCVD